MVQVNLKSHKKRDIRQVESHAKRLYVVFGACGLNWLEPCAYVGLKSVSEDLS